MEKIVTVYLQKERNKKKCEKKFGQELLFSLSNSKKINKSAKQAINKAKHSLFQAIVQLLNSLW